MDPELMQLCEQLVENRKVLIDIFKWDSQTMALASSIVLLGLNVRADSDVLGRCERIIESRTSAVSEFRGRLKLPLICKMAASKDPEQYFTDVEAMNDRMNKSKWLGNSYMLLASMILCDHIDQRDAQAYVDKTNEIYHCMKESHRWLTSDEDIPIAAMLAVSGIEVEKLISESERCYPILRDKFGIGSGNVVQALSHILALGKKSADEKCLRVAEIYDRLKEDNHKISDGQELESLGLLAVLDVEVATIVRDIVDVDDYLKSQKGFGDWDIGDSVRRMYAAMIVATLRRRNDPATESSILTGDALAVSMAMEICMTTTMLFLFYSVQR